MTLRERKIKRLDALNSYIRLGLENTEANISPGEWLYELIEHHYNEIVQEDLQNAIERRNRLNCGYTKAGH